MDDHQTQLRGHRAQRSDVMGEAVERTGSLAFSDDQELPRDSIGCNSDGTMPAASQGLIDDYGGHRREISIHQHEIDIARTVRIDAIPPHAGQRCHDNGIHLLIHNKDHRLEQQGEARQLAEPVRCHKDYAEIHHPHPWRTALEEAFVQKKVEMLHPLDISLLPSFAARFGETASGPQGSCAPLRGDLPPALTRGQRPALQAGRLGRKDRVPSRTEEW